MLRASCGRACPFWRRRARWTPVDDSLPTVVTLLLRGRRWLLGSDFRIDVLLTAAVAIVAYAVAYRTLTANYRVAPAIEDLFAICTGRLGWIPDPPATGLIKTSEDCIISAIDEI